MPYVTFYRFTKSSGSLISGKKKQKQKEIQTSQLDTEIEMEKGERNGGNG